MDNNYVEKEIKFLFSSGEAKDLMLKFDNKKGERVYEKTTMFDDKEKRMNAKDARLRVREIKRGNDTLIEFSYKRRLPEMTDEIKKEEEIEVAFRTNPELLVLILNKMGFNSVSSYERFRTTYAMDNTKVTMDEFPFGWVLEIEGEEEDINQIVKKLGLKKSDSTLESCDDVYDRLCREQELAPKNDILFGDENMPFLNP